MKLTIDNVEVNLVLSGLTISGNIESVARVASFSYLYNENYPELQKVKAKLDSKVVINDDTDTIFKGRITKIFYDTKRKIVQIQARDNLSLLLNSKLTGRFSGNILSIISRITSGINFDGVLNSLKVFAPLLNVNINIVSFKTFTPYDIISIAFKRLFEKGFKLYIDKNSKLKLFIPLLSTPEDEFTFGSDILSSSFSCEENHNLCQVRVIGNNNVVSGKVIRLKHPENENLNGEFLVIRDKHIYETTYTMTLELKERSLL